MTEERITENKAVTFMGTGYRLSEKTIEAAGRYFIPEWMYQMEDTTPKQKSELSPRDIIKCFMSASLKYDIPGRKEDAVLSLDGRLFPCGAFTIKSEHGEDKNYIEWQDHEAIRSLRDLCGAILEDIERGEKDE